MPLMKKVLSGFVVALVPSLVPVVGIAVLTTTLAAQGGVTHGGAGGQSFTITRVSSSSDPAPLSDNAVGTFNFEAADTEVGPFKGEGVANAYDQTTGWDASAEARDWDHSVWKIVADNAPPGYIMSVGGGLSAGGWTDMVNPPCSAFAACAHSVKVSLANGKNAAGVFLTGAATSVTGLVDWGQVTVNVAIPPATVGWQVTPALQVHQSGEQPITSSGAAGPNPGPGKANDDFSCWGVGTQCTITIQCGVHVKAYADGFWALLAWDAGQAKSYAITKLTFSVGGAEVDTDAIMDEYPPEGETGEGGGDQTGN
jgi:hypothetical protein